MSRRLGLVAAAVVAVLLTLELLAVPVAVRLLDRSLSRCVDYEVVEVRSLARPALPQLLLGRVRDLELGVERIDLGTLEIVEAELHLPDVPLPWGRGGDEPVAGELRLRILERDVERALRAALPVAVPIGVSLERDVVRLSAPLLPVSLDVAVQVEPDGAVRLLPARGRELLDLIGLSPVYHPPEDVRPTELVIDRGEVSGVLALADVPGFGDGEGCDQPVRLGAGTVAP